MNGKVSCQTCNISTDINANDAVNLIQALEVGVLSYHVKVPCSNNHELKIDIDFPFLEENLLEIECLKCKSTPRYKSKGILTQYVPLLLVNSAAICFHAVHEGHPFHLVYTNMKTKSIIFEVTSPGST